MRSGDEDADLLQFWYPVIGHVGNVGMCWERVRLNIRKHFFTGRLVKPQKRLRRDVVDAPSLSVCKRHLDSALNGMLLILVSPELIRHSE